MADHYGREIIEVLNTGEEEAEIERETAEGATFEVLLANYVQQFKHLEEWICKIKETADLQKSLENSGNDTLTGLPNRRAGVEQLLEFLGWWGSPETEAALAEGVTSRVFHTQRSDRRMMEHHHRRKEVEMPIPENVMVIMFDIDHFKRFNDTHGHEIGDEALREFAEQLRKFILENPEAAKEGAVVSRWGGEEFYAMVPLAPGENPEAYLQKLINYLQNVSISIKGKPKKIRSSAGVEVLPKEGALKIREGVEWAVKELDAVEELSDEFITMLQKSDSPNVARIILEVLVNPYEEAILRKAENQLQSEGVLKEEEKARTIQINDRARSISLSSEETESLIGKFRETIIQNLVKEGFINSSDEFLYRAKGVEGFEVEGDKDDGRNRICLKNKAGDPTFIYAEGDARTIPYERRGGAFEI